MVRGKCWSGGVGGLFWCLEGKFEKSSKIKRLLNGSKLSQNNSKIGIQNG